MNGVAGGAGGTSDPTAGLATSWGVQQMNSQQARPDDARYKKQQQNGSGPFGNDPFGTNSNSGGGGGMV